VELLFDRDEFVPDAMKGRTAPPDPTPLMRFMERLHAKQAELEEQGRRLEVTLSGPSMGSMVANRLLQRGMTFGDDADSAAPKSRAEQSEKAATHRNFTVPV